MTKIAQPLQRIVDNLSKSVFGITMTEAKDQNICIRCKEGIVGLLLSDLDLKEYIKSALCPKCFDSITNPKED